MEKLAVGLAVGLVVCLAWGLAKCLDALSELANQIEGGID